MDALYNLEVDQWGNTVAGIDLILALQKAYYMPLSSTKDMVVFEKKQFFRKQKHPFTFQIIVFTNKGIESKPVSEILRI